MFKKIFIIVLSAVIGLLLISSYMAKEDESISPTLSPNPSAKTLIRINNVQLGVEIADEAHEQTQGLSGRERLAQNEGMLFIFPYSAIPTFWMKDMLFSLDMIWIDENGKIVDITKNIAPETYPTTFSPPSQIKYVLEVNAGWSDANKIKIGHTMTGL